jgi:hypothetical protein
MIMRVQTKMQNWQENQAEALDSVVVSGPLWDPHDLARAAALKMVQLTRNEHYSRM